MTVVDDPIGDPVDDPVDAGSPRQWRWATAVFAVVVAGALPYILYQGRQQWFYLDEWDFLSDRSITSFSDLMRPHTAHWSLLPIVLYRVLYRLVGLHHYWPYQIWVLGAHLTVGVLIWVVMRRARVNPWIATAAASLFVLFGAGAQDIEWAFQIGFVGALAFGLGYLILVDHDGPLGRRDLLGAALGLAALFCSGVGVAMVAAAGAAVLIRRGWKAALTLTVPLGVIFAVWYVAYGRKGQVGGTPSVTDFGPFIWRAVANTFGQLGQVPGVGFLLAAVVVAGTVLIVIDTPRPQLAPRYAATVGLLVGAAVFLVVTAYGRAGQEGPFGDARASRYVHILAALLLPAIAAAASALARRWAPLVAVAVVLLLVGVPGNVAKFHPTGAERFNLGDPRLILTMGITPQLKTAPRSLIPLPLEAPWMTAGWLRGAKEQGLLPAPLKPVTPAERSHAVLVLSLEQAVTPSTNTGCHAVEAHTVVRVVKGQELELPTGTTVIRLSGSHSVLGVSYSSYLGKGLHVLQGPLALRLSPPTATATVAVCG